MAKTTQLIPALALLLTASGLSAQSSLEYQLVARYSHDRSSFTQGLEIYGDHVFESTGQYGQSTVQRYTLAEPRAGIRRKLPRALFGEGLTVLNDKVYQLTWRSGKAFVYEPEGLEEIDSFTIAGDGWGLTNNGSQLIYSDGSDKLYFLNPGSKRVERTVRVTMGGRQVEYLNELEWVEGRIFANVLPTNLIVVIDPDTGVVETTLDLEKLYPRRMRRSSSDIANGIAWDEENSELLVTGKNWPWIYRLHLAPDYASEN